MWWIIVVFAYIVGIITGIIATCVGEAASAADDVLEDKQRLEYYKSQKE
jgi:hypothetical protein